MRITFHIHYHTQWGQYLAVSGGHPRLGNWQDEQAIPMHHQGGGSWTFTMELPDASGILAYRYLLIDENNGTHHREWGAPREVTLPLDGTLQVRDAWRSPQHPDNALYTAPFREVLLPAPEVPVPEAPMQPGKVQVQWQLYAPRTRAGGELILMGNVPELGAWAPDKGLKLGSVDYPLWRTVVQVQPGQHLEYKFAWRESGTGKLMDIEAGENRTVFLPAGQHETWIITDDYYAYGDGEIGRASCRERVCHRV